MQPHLEIVGDEDPPDVELYVVSGCAVFVKRLGWLGGRHKQQCLERHLALSYEVSVCQAVLRVLTQALVELLVLLSRDLNRST